MLVPDEKCKDVVRVQNAWWTYKKMVLFSRQIDERMQVVMCEKYFLLVQLEKALEKAYEATLEKRYLELEAMLFELRAEHEYAINRCMIAREKFLNQQVKSLKFIADYPNRYRKDRD